MLSDAQNVLYNAPPLAIYPGAAIALSVLGLNLLGDGLRDALDPEAQGAPLMLFEVKDLIVDLPGADGAGPHRRRCYVRPRGGRKPRRRRRVGLRQDDYRVALMGLAPEGAPTAARSASRGGSSWA